jgi:polyisoprenoid-binding protein YceI
MRRWTGDGRAIASSSPSEMIGTAWTLNASDGELLLHTGVAGRAAKMGHRLTIAMTRWRATVKWSGGEPVAAELTVDVDSLEVLRGEGGVTPLSGPEKTLARSNALRQLDAGRFSRISFGADTIEKTSDGYRLTGTLQIRGKTRAQTVDLRVDDLGDVWELSSETRVRQSDFGVKRYSMLMGSMKVADDVTVSFSAQRAKGE